MGIRIQNVVVSTNVQPRLDGLPRSGEREPTDPGAAVYWHDPHATSPSDRVMAIDRYDRVADNLAAIAATLNAMRAIERHGGSRILQRAFTGFTALPAPGQTSAHTWREVFGNHINTVQELEAIYRRKRSEAHPQNGGSTDLFDTVQRAYEQGRMELETC